MFWVTFALEHHYSDIHSKRSNSRGHPQVVLIFCAPIGRLNNRSSLYTVGKENKSYVQESVIIVEAERGNHGLQRLAVPEVERHGARGGGRVYVAVQPLEYVLK